MIKVIENVACTSCKNQLIIYNIKYFLATIEHFVFRKMCIKQEVSLKKIIGVL